MSVATSFAARAAAQAANMPRVPLVRGQIFPIHLAPDPATGDRFTIGVAFIDTAGIVHCRVARDFSRLRCLYEDRVDIGSFELLRDVVEADLSGTVWTSPARAPSENLTYGNTVPAAGISVEEILDRAYDASVPFGADRAASLRVPTISRDRLQADIMGHLREILGARAAGLAGGKIKLPDRFGSSKILQFPLMNRRNGAAAELISARMHKSTVEHHLTRAVANLLAVRCAEPQAQYSRELGLFILDRPDNDSPQAAATQAVVDHLAGLANGAGVHVMTAPSERHLAETIAGWRPMAAA